MSDLKSRLPKPFPLPMGRLAGALVAASLAFAGGVGGLLALGRIDPSDGTGSLVGGLAAIAISAVSILAFRPWKPRTALAWQSVWMASTVIRLLLTPVVLVSVYFAALLPGGAVLLGGAAGYGLALLAESLVIVSAVPRHSPEGG